MVVVSSGQRAALRFRSALLPACISGLPAACPVEAAGRCAACYHRQCFSVGMDELLNVNALQRRMSNSAWTVSNVAPRVQLAMDDPIQRAP